MTTYDLKDKVVLITGAAGGIGAATARELYACGVIATEMNEVALLRFMSRATLPVRIGRAVALGLQKRCPRSPTGRSPATCACRGWPGGRTKPCAAAAGIDYERRTHHETL